MIGRRNFLSCAFAGALCADTACAATLGDWAASFHIGFRFANAGIPFRSFSMSGGSMAPNARWNDIVTADMRGAKSVPARGDITAFSLPGRGDWISRVVGLPGDRVEIRDLRVVLNGEPAVWEEAGSQDIDTPKGRKLFSLQREILPNASPYMIGFEPDLNPAEFPFFNVREQTVPEGRLVMISDNRMNAVDSRQSVVGLVPIENVIGRIVYRMRPDSGWLVPPSSVAGLPPE